MGHAVVLVARGLDSSLPERTSGQTTISFAFMGSYLMPAVVAGVVLEIGPKMFSHIEVAGLCYSFTIVGKLTYFCFGQTKRRCKVQVTRQALV